jgi:hypothetical protein
MGAPLPSFVDMGNSKIAHVLTGKPEDELLIAKTSGYGFICTYGDLLSRQKAGKAFLTVEDGATSCRRCASPARTTSPRLSDDGRLLLPARPDEAPVRRQGRADHRPVGQVFHAAGDRRLHAQAGAQQRPGSRAGLRRRRLLQHFPGALGIEIDPRHAPPGAEVMNFFELSDDEPSPPSSATRPTCAIRTFRRDPALARGRCSTSAPTSTCSSSRSACAMLEPGGELIFITPRDFLKATSAVPLNRLLFAQGRSPTSSTSAICTCSTTPRPTARSGVSSAAI